VVSILLLAAGFAGLCWLAGGVAHSANEAVLGHQRPSWFNELSVLWNLLQALGAALVAIVDHVGRGVILAGGLLILAMVAASACLGTAYVRFALNTARHN
jgi:hypothetical protein